MRGRDIGPRRNRPGRIYNIKAAPGPNGWPGNSFYFTRRPAAYVDLPNSGSLDTKNSITILTWIYPEGPGTVLEYRPGGFKLGVTRAGAIRVVFKRRTNKPSKTVRSPRGRVRWRQWYYIGVTYDQRRGLATVWREARPQKSKNIGWIQLATQAPVRLGGGPKFRTPYKGRIACVQIYSEALDGPQMKKVKNICFPPGEKNENVGFSKQCEDVLPRERMLLMVIEAYSPLGILQATQCTFLFRI